MRSRAAPPFREFGNRIALVNGKKYSGALVQFEEVLSSGPTN